MILRPYGVVLDGALELGLELVIEGGMIAEIRPHTGIPEQWVASVPFVNAHSHLEYRGLQGEIQKSEYWPWIREITRLRPMQTPDQVVRDCLIAAHENHRTGVALIGEHTDRYGAAEALSAVGIEGALFQELITFNEQLSPAAKITEVETRAAHNRTFFAGPVGFAPHAPYTVDEGTLRMMASTSVPKSIHLAEHPDEGRMFRHGEGPVADFYRSNGFEPRHVESSPTAYLCSLGFFRGRTQAVHCCDVDDADIELLSKHEVSIAHCARSNRTLGCPTSPVRRMVAAKLQVGIGLDSAASSGPIDMFAEMHAALSGSRVKGEPVSAETAWLMATTMGARSLWTPNWRLDADWARPFLAIDTDAHTTEELIERGKPERVRWIDPTSLTE